MTPYKINTNKTWADTIHDLDDTFRKWKVVDWSVTPMRPGRPTSTVDISVSVHFTKANGDQVSLMLDTQPSRRENLRALALAIEDMRMIEVRGVEKVFQQHYGQLARRPNQLQATERTVGELLPQNPYTLLGVRSDATIEVIEAAYRAKARKEHPEAGGSHERFIALNQAIATIRKERK